MSIGSIKFLLFDVLSLFRCLVLLVRLFVSHCVGGLSTLASAFRSERLPSATSLSTKLGKSVAKNKYLNFTRDGENLG